VAKKEQLIELLQEQRTALIARAVALGLDPNAPMKNSEIDWLGDIPAHWVVKKHSRCFRCSMGQTILKEDLVDDGEVPGVFRD
jgi:type I restriction enzyme S subunit